jgi:HlyD family secretion protein
LTPKPRNFLLVKNRKIIWFIAAIIVLAAAGGYTYYSKASPSTQTITESQVQTAVAERGNLVVSASGAGTLIANSDATFGFETSGQVKEVKVKVGDQVEAGQVLAQLDNTLAQMDYAEAQQALQELHSAASIATVQKEIGTAQDTEFSAREWLQYLISPEVEEAEENLALAQQKLADAQAAAKANPSAAADQTVKEKQQAVAFLQDKLGQAQTYYKDEYLLETFGEYKTVGRGPRARKVLVTTIDPQTGKEVPKINAPSIADIATARDDLAQALETIKEDEIYLQVLSTGVMPEGATGEKLTTLYNAQTAVDKAESALKATQLIAPINGTVTSLSLNAGQQVDTSSIITISQLDQPYTLDAYIDEADWNMATVGNKVNVAFKLLPDKTFSGTVTLVYPVLNASFDTSLVHLTAQLDQRISQDLPAGTGASVEVVGGEARNAVLVPVKAVHKTEDGKYAVTVLQNGKQAERAVEIGLQNSSYAEVKSGIEAGEVVVTK